MSVFCPRVRAGLAVALGIVIGTPVEAVTWRENTFTDFRRGESDDGGVNLYAAADGTVRSLYTFDYNRDGANDILFMCGHDNDYAPAAYIYMNQAGSYDPRFRWLLQSEGASGGTLADLDGDGWLDVILCGTSNGANSVALDAVVYFGAPQGYAKRRTVRLPTYQSRCVIAVDIDADGRLDLVFAQGQTPGVIVYRNGKDGFSPSRADTWNCPAASSCRVADVDADGHNDLVVLCGREIWIYPGGPSGGLCSCSARTTCCWFRG